MAEQDWQIHYENPSRFQPTEIWREIHLFTDKFYCFVFILKELSAETNKKAKDPSGPRARKYNVIVASANTNVYRKDKWIDPTAAYYVNRTIEFQKGKFINNKYLNEKYKREFEAQPCYSFANTSYTAGFNNLGEAMDFVETWKERVEKDHPKLFGVEIPFVEGDLEDMFEVI